VLDACLRQRLLGEETDGLCIKRVIAQSRDRAIHQGDSGRILLLQDTVPPMVPRASSQSLSNIQQVVLEIFQTYIAVLLEASQGSGIRYRHRQC
jgi:hypothetical protein